VADIWLIQYFECVVIKLECQHIVGNLFSFDWVGKTKEGCCNSLNNTSFLPHSFLFLSSLPS
jgi:hypothetical protein